ncbi:bifunctional tetrahydrofolate synthase/dihydrofolate synthase [Arsenophonus endosymbiont of Lipoptena cervi]|uniref:bifunctional tetrahydrofolate synthase/dihydrofolate synthase n=1 Tax=Arsenophonus TaxID=637 RepID=UPI00083747E6
MYNNFIKPGVNSSLDTWLVYLSNQHNKIIDLGLDRLNIVASKLDILNPAPIVITVAGTNGKGTTCHLLELILINAGLKVGVYNSPHLLHYTERVRIQGKTLPKELFCRVFFDIESKKGTTKLTYFEYATLAALQLFKETKLDVVILEVGLGGRLDATNIVNSNIAVITSIALDHTEFLGSNREKIGYEKAGIFRPGCYAVIGEMDIPNSIYSVAQDIGSKLFFCGIDCQFKLYNDYWNWKSHDYFFKKLPIPKIPICNAVTALAVISCLLKEDSIIRRNITLQAIKLGLINAKLPGRFQIIHKNPYIILDVAHNPHASAYLADKISCLPKHRDTKVYAVVAMLSNKDIKNTLSYLIPHVDIWYLASLNEILGASSDKLAQYVNSSYKFSTVEDAWLKVIKRINKQDILLVFGSFHTVAKVIEIEKFKSNLI